MNRRTFIAIAAGGAAASVGTAFFLCDKSNLVRSDLEIDRNANKTLKPDEFEILSLASLAPSGHNTQPWFVQYVEPYHWIIGNDRSKWLPGVDPIQRETMLSLGAFAQNVEYAASSFGLSCEWTLLAKTNQDEQVLDVRLKQNPSTARFDVAPIVARRVVRSGYLPDPLKNEDVNDLFGSEREFFRYLPVGSPESTYINEQTIEANRLQTYRDPAQQELANWIRLSSRDAALYRDGLTTASMEIEGVSGLVVRNFYSKSDVMKVEFREQGLAKVREQVSSSAGWILVTSKGNAVTDLLETGRRMQRLFLKIREKGIAIHPMTQILEEPSTKDAFARSVGVTDETQFILRTGYVKEYPLPVSLRRPVEWFVRH